MSSSENQPAFSEPKYAKAANTNLPWYKPKVDKYLSSETQDLLEKYSNIPRDQQSDHVHRIRDEAWAIRTYPCTGLGVFLMPYISYSPAYSKILSRLKAGSTLIDIGCFIGGDLRRLAFDGAPTSNMYGVDIVRHWDVGFDMYRDQGKFEAKFIEADMLSENTELDALTGKVDIISISAVLHQWDWEDQVRAAKKLIQFSKPGSIVVGHQIGMLEGRRLQNKAMQTWTFSHDPTTFGKLWDEVGKETGTVWNTEGWLHTFAEMGWDPKDQAWMEADNRVLDFVVTREK